MKLVTDGEKWSIRKGWWFFRVFYDMKTEGFWWSRNSKFFRDCWDSKDAVERIYRRMRA